MTTTSMSAKWKYMIIVLLFVGWSLGNLDRFMMNYAVITIKEDLGLSASSTGILLSSFFAGYALMQIPGGWLGDRFGFRKIIIISVLLWSIFTGLTGVAWSLWSMIIIRFLFGISEGSYFPSASKAIANWFPQNERSRAMSFMLASGSIMGVLTPLLGTLMMESIGWRVMFYIIGGAGLIMALLFVLFLKEQKNVPSNKATEKVNRTKAPLKTILKTPMIWNLFIAYFSIYAVYWGLMTWSPTYLHDVYGLDLKEVGIVSAIPSFIGIFSMFISGYILDKIPEGKDKLAAAIAAIISGLFLYLMIITPNITMFIIYKSLITICFSFNIVLIASAPLKMLPEEVIGSANGFINTGAQFAGVLTPMLIGFLVDAFNGSYNAGFILLVGFALLCGISLLLIRSSKNVSVDIASKAVN
ncbi:MFS transporter [Peribacillus frigoritolerans]|uniref:MFS transporter n=1 Tax=Peribacillus frigoritolerans TaxID=450367 RepID=UPI003812AB82